MPFDPAEAPSPLGWSKRRANAKLRDERNSKMSLLREARQAHYAAQQAGFATADEHRAHLEAKAAHEAPKAAESHPAPKVVIEEPTIAEVVAETLADLEAAIDARPEKPKAPKGSQKIKTPLEV